MAFFRNPCVNLRDHLPACLSSGRDSQACRQVRRTGCTPPHHPLISLALRKNSHFRIGNSPVSRISFPDRHLNKNKRKCPVSMSRKQRFFDARSSHLVPWTVGPAHGGIQREVFIKAPAEPYFNFLKSGFRFSMKAVTASIFSRVPISLLMLAHSAVLASRMPF